MLTVFHELNLIFELIFYSFYPSGCQEFDTTAHADLKVTYDYVWPKIPEGKDKFYFSVRSDNAQITVSSHNSNSPENYRYNRYSFRKLTMLTTLVWLSNRVLLSKHTANITESSQCRII